MQEKTKKQELLITVGIPLVVSLVGIFLTLFGEKYILHIFITASAFVIIIIFIFYAIRFLEDKENRWKTNHNKHNELEISVANLQQEVRFLKQNYEINEKINKLENQISYISGRLKK